MKLWHWIVLIVLYTVINITVQLSILNLLGRMHR
jgi:hypothetical protein